MASCKSSGVKCKAWQFVEGCLPGSRPCGDVCLLHDRKLRICDELEAIADRLPSVDRLKCRLMATELVPLLRMSHAREEEHLFPALAKDATEGKRMASLGRLRAEHIEDECAAQDLTDTLLTIGHGGGVANPEALGFMLRAFFRASRRHIAFEREHVLPFIAQQNRTKRPET
ncbi:hemerythrin domain-containing protein [Mesorhizobium sp. WSM3626]|uniref:hemerythrin domain-containing protein n=1 Tax=Mesorhizobium sp. WSM3626 TaxID=1040987 RepID=UPI000A0000CA|nr:hemerythrin domain-containing protein [Mesorhizobium sp. WSM3626]